MLGACSSKAAVPTAETNSTEPAVRVGSVEALLQHGLLTGQEENPFGIAVSYVKPVQEGTLLLWTDGSAVRISLVDAEKKVCMLGIVRHDALLVREFPLVPGKIYYLSTYEKNVPCRNHCDDAFEAASAAEVCSYMISGGEFASFEKPVTAASALWNGSSYELAVCDAEVQA